MHKTHLLTLPACLLWLLACLTTARAQENRPFLHELFTDNMVLQRERPVPVWGWTEPGKQVLVSMNGKSAKATADAQGKWMAHLGPFTAGGPYTLTVAGPETLTVKNVLVGDVWICSGQSNMEMGIGNVNNAQDEIAQADYPNIRLFTVPKRISYEPTRTVAGHWDVCSPATVSKDGWGGFSAVAYFFGRHLYKELKVPIGLIHTSWGGTIAEAWTSAEALKTMDDFRPVVEGLQKTVLEMKKGSADFDRQMAEWWQKNDPGSANGLGWADPKLDVSGWKTMKLPAAWEQAGLPDYDGVVWFRKEFDLPAGWQGKDLMLHLGPIDDRDTTWVNGVQVGGLNEYNAPRNYKVPASALKPGRNVISVRVLDTGGAGGLYGQPDQMRLELPGDSNGISLAGDWSYRDSLPLAKAKPMPQRLDNNPNVTTVLYNGMIAPLLPFGIKGAIWYQGESNAGRAAQYRTLLPTMIKDWRARFGSGEFPFFIVQLANFLETAPEPTDDPWPYLREAQLYTTRVVPKTALALAIDIGDAKDIHPKNKQEVGRRLALDALAIAYGQPVEYSGPAYRSMQIKGSTIQISFSHLGGGLEAKGDSRLQGFAIAGEDMHFVWADAKIEGDMVVVSSPRVEKPLYVRYAWANNPIANLYNKAGLPASPFRTDRALK